MKILIILTIGILLILNLALLGESKPKRKTEIHKSITRGSQLKSKVNIIKNEPFPNGVFAKTHPAISVGNKAFSTKTTITKRIKKTGKGRPKITKKISKVYIRPKTVARVPALRKPVSVKRTKQPIVRPTQNKELNITKSITKNIGIPLNAVNAIQATSKVQEALPNAPTTLSSTGSQPEAIVSDEFTKEIVQSESESIIPTLSDSFVTQPSETLAISLDTEENIPMSEPIEIDITENKEEVTENMSLNTDESEIVVSVEQSSEITLLPDESTESIDSTGTEESTESTLTTEETTLSTTVSTEESTPSSPTEQESSESTTSSEESSTNTPTDQESAESTTLESSTPSEEPASSASTEPELAESTASSEESSESTTSTDESTEATTISESLESTVKSNELDANFTSTTGSQLDVVIEIVTESIIIDTPNESTSQVSEDDIAININATQFITAEDILNAISNEATFEVSKVISNVADTGLLQYDTENQANETSDAETIAQSPDMNLSKEINIAAVEEGTETQETSDMPSLDLEITKTINETFTGLDDAPLERDARSARKLIKKKITISEGKNVHGKRVHRDFRETYFLLQ